MSCQPDCEFPVFEDHKGLVKEANVIQKLPFHHECGGECGQVSEQKNVKERVFKGGAAATMKRRDIVVDEPHGRLARARPLATHESILSIELVSMPKVISIQKSDVLTSCRFDAGVARPGRSEVALLDDTNSRIIGCPSH